MKKFILAFLALIISASCSSQSWEWAFPTRNLEKIKTVIADNDEIFLVANFTDSCAINNTIIQSDSASNVLIAKISPGGSVLWTRLFSGASLGFINIQAENNNLVIAILFHRSITGPFTASAQSGFLIARFSSNGTVISHMVDGNTRYLSYTHMALLNNGDVLISGTAYDSISLGGSLKALDPHGDGFVAKYDINYHLKMFKQLHAVQYGAYQSLGIYTDSERNFYLDGGGGDSLIVVNDTILSFDFPFSNLVQFDSNGTVRAYHTTCTYFPHLTHFAAYNNGAYSIELWENGGCNHCNTGLIIRRTAADGTDDWIHSYQGTNYYGGPPQFGMYPGGMTASENELFFTAQYSGALTLGPFSMNSRSTLIVKMDHDGNYLTVDSLEFQVSPDELSNIKNRALIASGYYGGNPTIGGFQLDSAPPYYTNVYKFGFVAKYKDTLATGIANTSVHPEVLIFPNPTEGMLKIGLQNNELISHIDLYETTGKLIRSETINKKQCECDLSGFRNGFYLLKITSGEQIATHKLIISKK